ncbi:MAG: MerR family transcriptional regulator [Cyanobacteria bacterium P01_H01_bin.150]
MQEKFFTSREAAEITGCSRRQLQYWRDKKVIVPTVNTTGKGKNVYYSKSDLLVLTVMYYLLSRGLNFEVCQQTLEILKHQESWMFEYSNKKNKKFLLIIDSSDEHLKLKDFDTKLVLEAIDKYKCVISIASSYIHKELQHNLKRFTEGTDITR